MTESGVKQEKEQHERFYDSAFLELLGAELGSLSERVAEIRLQTKPEHGNRNGNIHGGVLATLVDAALNQSVRTVIGTDVPTTTIEFKINYLAPATKGLIIARGEAVQIGGSLATSSVTVTSNGVLVAMALGTIRLFRKKS